MLVAALGLTDAELGIGVGIHSGELNFGEFGKSHRDLTAIGTVVNLASRAQSAAAAGEILVTQVIYERAPSVGATAGAIGRGGQLRHYALQAELAGVPEERRATADDMLGVTDWAPPILKRIAALMQRI
jgi:class 3 adenylate cyclase